MAMDINTGMVVGNLTQDPEYVERGEMQFCDLRIAVMHSVSLNPLLDHAAFVEPNRAAVGSRSN